MMIFTAQLPYILSMLLHNVEDLISCSLICSLEYSGRLPRYGSCEPAWVAFVGSASFRLSQYLALDQRLSEILQYEMKNTTLHVFIYKHSHDDGYSRAHLSGVLDIAFRAAVLCML
jgi:hypothetical protein